MLQTSRHGFTSIGCNSLQIISTESAPADLIPATSPEPVLQEADVIPGYQYIVPPPELFTPTELSPLTYHEKFYTTFRQLKVPGLSQQLGLIILSAMSDQDAARLPLFEGACEEYSARVLQAIQTVLSSSSIENEILATEWHIMACAINHGYLTRADIFGNKPINLNYVDLSGMNLAGINLTGADLWFAILIGANLRGANLSKANLVGVNLSSAFLTSAQFFATNLLGADLHGSELRHTDFSMANLVTANLADTDLYSTKFSGADLTGVNFSGANLTSADLTNTNFIRSIFKHTNLSRIKNQIIFFNGKGIHVDRLELENVNTDNEGNCILAKA